MNNAQIALLAIKQSTKNTELSQAHSNITKKHQPKPLETFIIQRQAPSPGLNAEVRNSKLPPLHRVA